MTTGTTVVTAVFWPLDGRDKELRDALSAAIPAVHAEEGCLLYALHEAADGSFVLIEKWASQQALDAHAAGEPVKRLDASVEGLLRELPTVVTMVPAAGDGEGKGVL